MGPINAVNPSPVGLAPTIASRATRPLDMVRPDAATGALQPAAASSAGPSSQVSPLHAALSQLLQSSVGGSSNDQNLQLLIGLIVLLAVLQTLQQSNGPSGNPLEQLGSTSNGQLPAMTAYSSSTTITIEQTQTMVSLANGSDFAAGSQAPRGGQVDLSA